MNLGFEVAAFLITSLSGASDFASAEKAIRVMIACTELSANPVVGRAWPGMALVLRRLRRDTTRLIGDVVANQI